jgi:hypothetical protein
VYQDEVIAVAAYDLDSGDAYTTFINPALHNPRYKFGAEENHGESAGKAMMMLISGCVLSYKHNS